MDGPTICGQLEREKERIDLPILIDLSDECRTLYPFDPELKIEHDTPEDLNRKGPIQEEVQRALKLAGAIDLATGIGLSRNRFKMGRNEDLTEIPLTSERLSSTIMDDPHAITRVLEEMKRIGPSSSPLYLPGAGGSEDLEVLFYLGVEIFDTSRAKMEAFSGRFYTMSSYISTEAVIGIGGVESVCSCKACRESGKDGISPRSVSDHNVAMMVRRLAMAHLKLKEGKLREHVMGVLSGKPAWMSVLRRMERGDNWDILSHTHSWRRNEQVPVTYRDDLNSPDFRLWRERLKNDFTPLEHKKVLLLLPCSASKPYSGSRTHTRIAKELSSVKGWKAICQRLVLTSPIGVVPMELESLYPASHYDIPVTGSWFHDEIEIIRGLTSSVIKKGDFRTIVSFHRESREFFPEGSDGIFDGVEFVDVHLLSEKEGRRPEDVLREVLASKMQDQVIMEGRRNEILEALKLIEFSLKVHLEPMEGFRIKRSWRGIELMRGKISLFDLQKGGPVPTLQGAEMMWNSEGQGKRVLTGDFTPKGTLFSQGVMGTSGDIRPMDIVLIGHGKDLRGVGRALIPGNVMTSGISGKAVKMISYKKESS